MRRKDPNQKAINTPTELQRHALKTPPGSPGFQIILTPNLILDTSTLYRLKLSNYDMNIAIPPIALIMMPTHIRRFGSIRLSLLTIFPRSKVGFAFGLWSRFDLLDEMGFRVVVGNISGGL
jgi:hypothetical protein